MKKQKPALTQPPAPGRARRPQASREPGQSSSFDDEAPSQAAAMDTPMSDADRQETSSSADLQQAPAFTEGTEGAAAADQTIPSDAVAERDTVLDMEASSEKPADRNGTGNAAGSTKAGDETAVDVPAEADAASDIGANAVSAAEVPDAGLQAETTGVLGDEAGSTTESSAAALVTDPSDAPAQAPGTDALSDSASRESAGLETDTAGTPASASDVRVSGTEADAPGAASRGDQTSEASEASAAPDMTSSSASALSGPPATGGAAGQQPRRGGVLPVVISLFALLGVGALGWQVYELRLASKETRQEVAQRLVAGDTDIAEIRALTRQQHESLAALQGRFGAVESQVAASEGQAAALELMYLEHSRSRSDQILSEVEQAINIAAQQLHLAGNFEAALIALQSAESRLNQPEVAHLQPLRRALIKDIDELKAHPQVDVSGLALRLEILLDRIDGLPLAFEVALQQAAAAHEKLVADHENGEVGPFELSLSYARALAADVWSEVKSMVRLERLDQADPVLLSPEQSTYLRENVKIRLLTARLALLGRDARTYAADLGQAREWIERYFDTRNDQVKRVVADLTELEQTPVKAEQPSLSETFAALRLLQARPSGVRSSAAGSAAADGSR